MKKTSSAVGNVCCLNPCSGTLLKFSSSLLLIMLSTVLCTRVALEGGKDKFVLVYMELGAII